MTATNTAPNAPSAALYAPIESKAALMKAIRDDLTGADLSRIQDLLLKLGATLTSMWHDPDAVSS